MDHSHRRDAIRNMASRPYVFLISKDDLQTMLDTLDDATLCEVVAHPSISQMQVSARQMVEWLRHNLTSINTEKTKEMLLGPILLNPPSQILVNDGTVERVTSFKLLELVIANNFSSKEQNNRS